MTDVFISYSRKDKAFVQVLNDALVESKYDAWVDWENIPLTADWWAEIQAGIEAADTFIFVITPDSIASHVCGQEIDHAVENNKRLVPIVRQEGFDMSLVRPALAKANWLFFKAEDDFEAAFQSLVDTLNTDLTHVKTHTQLLVKALEWQHKAHNPDLLLRGSQLESIVGWITVSADKEPRLTQEQREYVAASTKAEKQSQEAEIARQQAEIERQKKAQKTITLALIGASVGFVVATGLGLFAAKQRQLAEAREINAQVLAQSYKVENWSNSGLQIDALVEAVRSYQEMDTKSHMLDPGQKLRIISSLQQVLSGIVEQNRLEGHGSYVNDVRFSPDGQTIVSASGDGRVKLWNLAGEELKTFKDTNDFLYRVSFSPDGQTIASAGHNGIIKLWSLAGEELRTVEGHNGSVRSIRFSPDGQSIATAGEDGTIKLWKASGEHVKTLIEHDSGIRSMSFSPDGQQLVSGIDNGTIQLFDLDGEVIRTFRGHNREAIRDVNFSPDGQILASSSGDGTVKLWSLQGEELQVFNGHSTFVISVRFSPDGKTLASGSGDGVIKLWDLDGKELATLEGHSGWVNGLSFSPDGQTLASASGDRSLKLWNFRAAKHNVVEGHNHELNTVNFSPDGQMLASASNDGTIKLWNRQGEELNTLKGHAGPVYIADFSTNGQMLASATYDGTVKLWNLEGEELRTLDGHRGAVWSVDFSPDDQRLATASVDETIKLWSLDGQEINTLVGHNSYVTSVHFSPNGKTLASGSGDGTIKLWNLQGEELKTFEGHSSDVIDVRFSPDGQTLASSSDDGTVRLWNLDGEELATFEGHTGSVRSVRFSPDGQTLASSSADRTIKLWSLQGELLKTFVGHDSWVNSVSFSSDGHTLVSASSDNTIRLWNLDGEALIQESCAWLNHYLISHPDVLSELTACHTSERLKAAATNLVRIAELTAAAGRLQTAKAQLAKALVWNPEIDLDPSTFDIEQDTAQVALKFTADYYRKEGQTLANQLKVEEAVRAYEKALELDPSIDFNSDTEATEQNTVEVAYQLAAFSYRQRGQIWAEELKIEAAINAFEEAITLLPDIDLNPDTQETEQDPEAMTLMFSAPGHITEGKRQVRNGQVGLAIQAYQTAQELNPGIKISQNAWDDLCWFGSLHGQAGKVRFACENEAVHNPSHGSTLEARGIIKALNGDIEGAIQNFRGYIRWSEHEGRDAQARVWIDALEAGENPFIAESSGNE
jgi:WD40 repeat protein